MTGEVAAEFGLHHPSPLYKSFFRYNAFKNPVSASDVVHAVTALLEMGGDESTPLDGSAPGPASETIVDTAGEPGSHGEVGAHAVCAKESASRYLFLLLISSHCGVV
jgi:hypothetical protein